MHTWQTDVSEDLQKSFVPAVFLHIQKTAGTSLVHLAARHYGTENIITHGDYVGRPPESLVDVPFVSGHFGYAYARSLIRERVSFTFLRDPAERILSLYYFYRSQDPNLFPMYRIAHESTLGEFLERGLSDPYVRSRIWNNQTWQLAHGYSAPDRRSQGEFSPQELIDLAMAHVQEFSYVGLTEEYGDGVRAVTDLLGWSSEGEEVRENTNKDRKTAGDLSEREGSLIRELTSLDEALYQYVKAAQRAGLGAQG